MRCVLIGFSRQCIDFSLSLSLSLSRHDAFLFFSASVSLSHTHTDRGRETEAYRRKRERDKEKEKEKEKERKRALLFSDSREPKTQERSLSAIKPIFISIRYIYSRKQINEHCHVLHIHTSL